MEFRPGISIIWRKIFIFVFFIPPVEYAPWSVAAQTGVGSTTRYRKSAVDFYIAEKTKKQSLAIDEESFLCLKQECSLESQEYSGRFLPSTSLQGSWAHEQTKTGPVASQIITDKECSDHNHFSVRERHFPFPFKLISLRPVAWVWTRGIQVNNFCLIYNRGKLCEHPFRQIIFWNHMNVCTEQKERVQTL